MERWRVTRLPASDREPVGGNTTDVLQQGHRDDARPTAATFPIYSTWWQRHVYKGSYSATYNPGQRRFYNLGSESWLALAVDCSTSAQACGCPLPALTDFGPAVMQPAGILRPNQPR